MKKIDEIANEYIEKTPIVRIDKWMRPFCKAAFINGYESASFIKVSDPAREIFRIKNTPEGIDIQLGDGVTLTEAAEKFVSIVRERLKEAK